MEHKIVIVDDHVLIAQAIAELVNKFTGYSVLYEAENGEQLMQKFKVAKNIPDIVLLDIVMPRMDGFATAAWLKANHPGVLVMALTAQDDDLSLIGMVKAGATGYVLKNTHPKVLEKALDSFVANGYYYPEGVANKIISGMMENKLAAFSDREHEFLAHCCSEMTYKEIAAKMFCSVHTVEGYRDALFEKLNLKTRVGLAMYAMKNGKCR
jgi:DNA-binding NarL/FixJ family response regulator